MGLKLRRTMEYVQTDGAVVCRHGTRLLPVRGDAVGVWFGSLWELLDGTYSLVQLAAKYPAKQRAPIAQLLRALTAAGMVYETAAEPPPAGPPLERARPARVRILGEPRLASQLAAAARETALPVEHVVVSDLVGLERVTREGAPESGLAAIAVDAAEAGANIDACLRAADLPGQVVVPLLRCRNDVVVGPACGPHTAGCIRCLYLHYRARDGMTADRAPAQDGAVAIGLSLHALRLERLMAGSADADESLSYNVATATLEISTGPVSPHWACTRCGPLTFESALRPAVRGMARDEVVTDASVNEIYARIEKRIVHPKTGLVDVIDEGALTQLPYQQTEARWQLPHAENRWIWTSDAGCTRDEARARVLRRVLEAHVHQRLSARISPSAVIASGLTVDELFAEGFFRSLSRQAMASACWSRVDVDQPVAAGGSDLVREYLKETGVMPRVRVERCASFVQGDCECLRFYCDDRLVDVVSGWPDGACWETGLTDVWLYATGRQHQAPDDVVPGCRLRSAVSTIDWNRLQATLDRLGLTLTLREVSGRLPDIYAPLKLAVASLDENGAHPAAHGPTAID
jgi:bacteriocin biosynthesis cyclodehydratase domain-containing protein